MTNNTQIQDEYFDWLGNKICENHFDFIKYKSLLLCLHDTPFKFSIFMDENRAINGEELRWDFASECDYIYDEIEDALDFSVSVLEVMVALCIKIEQFMMNCTDGDRTGVWFWDMIASMHLSDMTNARFDYPYVRDRIDIFLNREYSENGDGGLFFVEDCEQNMREIELWKQADIYMSRL